MAEPLVLTERLTKHYPGGGWLRRRPPREALRAVNLRFGAGERVALVGSNGAGKSSLLRLLAGLLLPTSGSARVAGLDIARDRPASRSTVSFVAHPDRSLAPRLSGRHNLHFYGALHGLGRAEAAHSVEELARLFEASHLLDRPVRTLSSGERARLGLVRALLHRPRVLLLDEATRALDPGAAERVRSVLARTFSEGLILFATHDLAEVATFSTRTLLLSAGEVAAEGPFAAIESQVRAAFSVPTGVPEAAS